MAVSAYEGVAEKPLRSPPSWVFSADRKLCRINCGGGPVWVLAIVAEVVAAHGGTVNIEDRYGGGAMLIVMLPQHTNR